MATSNKVMVVYQSDTEFDEEMFEFIKKIILATPPPRPNWKAIAVYNTLQIESIEQQVKS